MTLVEADAHQKAGKLDGLIDLLFPDTDKEGYLVSLKQLLPKLRLGPLVVARIINERQADPR